MLRTLWPIASLKWDETKSGRGFCACWDNRVFGRKILWFVCNIETTQSLMFWHLAFATDFPRTMKISVRSEDDFDCRVEQHPWWLCSKNTMESTTCQWKTLEYLQLLQNTGPLRNSLFRKIVFSRVNLMSISWSLRNAHGMPNGGKERCCSVIL